MIDRSSAGRVHRAGSRPPGRTSITDSTVIITVAKAPTTGPGPDVHGSRSARRRRWRPRTIWSWSRRKARATPSRWARSSARIRPPGGAGPAGDRDRRSSCRLRPGRWPCTDVTCLSFGSAQVRAPAQGSVVRSSVGPHRSSPVPEPEPVAIQDPAAGTAVDAGTTVTLYTGGTTRRPDRPVRRGRRDDDPVRARGVHGRRARGPRTPLHQPRRVRCSR